MCGFDTQVETVSLLSIISLLQLPKNILRHFKIVYSKKLRPILFFKLFKNIV